jgi:TldD protein
VAPAMLVSQIETQRQAQGTARPPIVPPPPLDDVSSTSSPKGGR